jgi:amino acid adenylation domain-containing protein
MSERSKEGIAIIGMAGRFPGAASIEEFWENLLAGKESISFFNAAELAESGLDETDLMRRGLYIPARGILQDADCFDAGFFGIHPKEAEVMDPQQRVFLEACWAALERAGYAPNLIRGSVGVFAGTTFNTYYMHVLQQRPDLTEMVGSDLVMFGNEKDYLTTRVAYKLGLKGPALAVSTACSTSLVAVCQACQSLLTYQCDMALAGGASVRVPQKSGYYYDEGNIASSDGHTRTFDSNAAGTVFSNGVGVVVLKRLEDALNEGDQIYAVIKGAALNNDGSNRVSFGAPGVEGQSEVIAMAHALAGIDPETITYVEAHGTATPLGDPIEVAGLTKAFRLGTEARRFCALGSVKTNVGHLEAAAGVTGLIKTALALRNKIIPASLHFRSPNPKLDIENSPFYVNATLQEWKSTSGTPLRAGVSSFGTGGTNAHVVLEEPPEIPPSGPSRPWKLLVVSAKTADALDRATVNLHEQLKKLSANQNDDAASRELADAAFTLQLGRSEFVHRRIVACRDASDGATALEARDTKRVFTHHQKLSKPPVVFMFPGQGAQYCGMGADLYRYEPAFRAEIDRCMEVLQPILGTDLRTILFPRKGLEKDAEQQIVQTRFTQPALFVIEYALAKLWMSWGIQPTAMIGHSVGEYAAACLSGVFTLEDALSLVAHRGALVQAQPGGSMLSIRLPETEVLPLLNPQLAIAAINSHNLCVVAGPHQDIGALEKQLESRGVMVRHLHTSHGFHSPMMDPVLEPFTDLLRRVKYGELQIPFVSNVTARWITPQEATSPEYWAGHVRQTVRFADGIAELLKDARNVLIEVGPGQTLCTLARQHKAKLPEQTVLASLPVAGAEEGRGILETLGRLWSSGLAVDWQAYYANERRLRVVLPTYPFERKRIWPESVVESGHAPSSVANAAAVVGEGIIPPAAPSADAQTLKIATSVLQSQPDVSRNERLLVETRLVLQNLSGYDLSGVDPSSNLLELGLDSLLLTQASILFQRKFGIPITFRQLMEDISSLDAIALYLDAKMPAEAFASAPVPSLNVASDVSTGKSPSANIPNSIFEQLLQQQQQLTNQLLQLMGRQPDVTPAPPPTAQAAILAPAMSAVKSHGPFKPIDRKASTALTSEQTRALDALIARYTRLTAGSKRLTVENRPFLADPRSIAGFNKLWKEMVYPIVTTRSSGSKVWDVDGNEYVDFVMGFGASMFGHRPPFVVEAIREQLDRGFEIGPIQPLAGEVASLIREFTGMQRVTFTNTGSEAVLAATRVSRTVTGRDKIAVFAGSYHGIFDEVLFRPLTVNGETHAAPIAPGVPESALAHVIVLDYGNPQSLEIIRARGSEIAAVLVEPVQSRRLDLQPKEFLQELRRITRETGTALIFDEVVTGFRLQPGGAQAYFGVRADLATYGKVIGGGFPIGVVAGDARFMDALDGGQWQYGDTSFPEVGVTFFAGTFVRHPLALAATQAVLKHLKQSGPELQRRLAEKTVHLAEKLRAVIDEYHAPYQLTQFSSLMQLNFPSEQKFAGLLYYLLRERGIHIYENRAFVMTTAHSEEDLDRLIRAFRESLSELVAGGFLPASGAVEIPAASMASQAQTAGKEGEPSGTFPLTEAQKEIWLAAQMGGDAAVAYNESLKLQFRGNFDADLFRSAVFQIVKRHPILTANFSPDGDWQRVPPDSKIEVPLVDLSAMIDADRDRELAAIIEREVSEPFDLAGGALLKVIIVRLSPGEHVALWTAHHIVCDGWSGELLISELAEIYSALKKGIVPALDTPVPFRKYAMATQDDEPIRHDALKYWRQLFNTLPPPLDLPTDRPRPLVRSAKASTQTRGLDLTIYQSLKRTAGQQRTTMVVLLMTAVKTLLHRLTGQTDFVIGISAAGQAVTGNTCLVGHCVNLLPIRTQLQKDASFQENLASVKKSVLDAFDHHQCTTGTILQQISVPRIAGRPPLVEVIFNVDQDPGEAEFYGTEFACHRNPKRALHYDLFFNIVEGSRGIYVECDYNTDLFDAATIERWLKHFQTLLESIAANPAEPIGKLPILTETERNELTIEWNKTGVEYSKGRTLQEWFECQVEKTPNATALTFEGKHLSYSELNVRANQLAHYLKGIGVGPDVLVGLYIDRSMDMVVGIIGVMKAGGAYLPIDPVYPKDRVSFMLQDANAPVLITQAKFMTELPEHKAKVVRLDTDLALLEGEPDSNPPRNSTPDDLAYVIYTSGSTGKPKGVLVTQYNVVRLMQATEHWFQFNKHDVWTFFHSHAFDFSVWEIWGALLYGGRLVVVPYMASRSPEEFYDLIVSERVTVLNQTPSAFKQLIQTEAMLDTSKQLALRYVIFGGEALEMQSLKPWFDRHGDQHPLLVNMYGITETTVHVTYRPLTAADIKSGSTIGVPIPDLQIYLFDSYQQPVPIGAIGEIFVGGAGVARGYLNREELTRNRFQPDTFRNQPGGFLYRSGDLARYLPNRDIEYIGRIDDQVKIRGFRIELGEIEAVLGRHAAVRQCVVVAREEIQGDKILVAYFEHKPGSFTDIGDLRAHMKKALPEYMIPSAFVPMEKMPLTPNGKIDRKALPYVDDRRNMIKREYVAPRDSFEQTLAQLWAKILKVKRVGLNDNFFELGGHSILAVRIIVEIEKLYKKRLPLAALLQAPTIHDLAEILRKDNSQPSWSSLVPIRPGGSKPPLFLMHSHGGNVLEYFRLANYLGTDQPVYALQARGLDGRIPKGQSIEEMASVYLKELRSLQPEGPYYLGGFCFGGLLALEAAQQLKAVGEHVGLVVLIQAIHPAFSDFGSDITLFRRWWYRATKRVDLERENLSYRGTNYIFERSRRLWEIARVRTAMAINKITGNGHSRRKPLSMAYILESLGIEHDKAYRKYIPGPYSGDVLIFRARKQLRGLMADWRMGWKDVFHGNLNVFEVPGHQQNLLIEPNVLLLAEELTARLATAQEEHEIKAGSQDINQYRKVVV